MKWLSPLIILMWLELVRPRTLLKSWRGIVLGTMVFGAVANHHVAALKDIGARETLILALLAVAVLAMGLYPQPMAQVLHTSISDLLALAARSKLAFALGQDVAGQPFSADLSRMPHLMIAKCAEDVGGESADAGGAAGDDHDLPMRAHLILALAASPQLQAARPFVTDDARIVDPDGHQIETFYKRQRAFKESEYWFLPAINPGKTLGDGKMEFTLGRYWVNTDSPGDNQATLAQVKTLLKPLETNGQGFALTLGVATALDLFVVYFFKRPVVFLIAPNERLVQLRGFGLTSGVSADHAAAPVVAGGSE